ncbi:acyl-CoA N-acyltransferase [Trametes versicolor FP-101664 SS1]|uniref:acyl-CoA N-acyltransferase n=1 Tax=Trametes versicolor (strain FP-101664) TaxID=717944 RepID=UPI00046213CD|nr:acyl-CoA N-acyltransferase [Trametes versicolor FP-101664 SS1]EIW65327.1 acyl-CoA N-acyltransferase [Trametes versicolor FP-101664 SS1]
MRANENTVIVHPDVVLVPYRTEHIAKYHEWMTSAELRELTASEPLTLDEEYEMQRKWQTDEDKLTFIVLDGTRLVSAEGTTISPESLRGLPMIGDVNLFLKGTPDEEEFEAEAEIMVAEPAYRRRGIAFTALQLMLSYATDPLSPSPLPVRPEKLVARIGDKNEPSIRLFEKLGFSVTKIVAVFEEVELRYTGTNGTPWIAGTITELSM